MSSNSKAHERLRERIQDDDKRLGRRRWQETIEKMESYLKRYGVQLNRSALLAEYAWVVAMCDEA